jgi:hypothetical protein
VPLLARFLATLAGDLPWSFLISHVVTLILHDQYLLTLATCL